MTVRAIVIVTVQASLSADTLAHLPARETDDAARAESTRKWLSQR